jgi:hypothetical protein
MNAIRPSARLVLLSGLAAALSVLVLIACERASAASEGNPHNDTEAGERAFALAEKGKQVFRFDSLGSEAFWGDALRIHETIAGAALGGVGPGVSPATALAVGLKVDEEALPGKLKSDLLHGRVDLGDPANTVALLKLDAVVGVRGFFEQGSLRSIGISCALCHSTVDDSLLPGIGRRLDGWPKPRPPRRRQEDQPRAGSSRRSPTCSTCPRRPCARLLASWGPGRFDARPDPRRTGLPSRRQERIGCDPGALGLGGVNLATYSGLRARVPHWNGFVGQSRDARQGALPCDPRLR